MKQYNDSLRFVEMGLLGALCILVGLTIQKCNSAKPLAHPPQIVLAPDYHEEDSLYRIWVDSTHIRIEAKEHILHCRK